VLANTTSNWYRDLNDNCKLFEERWELGHLSWELRASSHRCHRLSLIGSGIGSSRIGNLIRNVQKQSVNEIFDDENDRVKMTNFKFLEAFPFLFRVYGASTVYGGVQYTTDCGRQCWLGPECYHIMSPLSTFSNILQHPGNNTYWCLECILLFL
jgi:hypothetical protein